MRYSHAIVSGTFDGLHQGHQAMLRKAFAVAQRVSVCLTSDMYVSVYKRDIPHITPQIEREVLLRKWLKAQGVIQRAKIVYIDDPFGPSVSQSEHKDTSEDYDAIVVSAETRIGGQRVNQKRKEAGLPPLAIVEVPMVPAEDGKPISSTRVRRGEINTSGSLVMPEELRMTLGQPMGKVLIGSDIARSISGAKDKIIVTVGDMSTKTLFDHGIIPSLSIVDGAVERKPYDKAINEITKRKIHAVSVASGPGFISREALAAIQERTSPMAIIVTGEEDLLTLPVLLQLPDGAIIYYGQPGVGGGMVEVVCSPQTKATAQDILSRFGA